MARRAAGLPRAGSHLHGDRTQLKADGVTVRTGSARETGSAQTRLLVGTWASIRGCRT